MFVRYTYSDSGLWIQCKAQDRKYRASRHNKSRLKNRWGFNRSLRFALGLSFVSCLAITTSMMSLSALTPVADLQREGRMDLILNISYQSSQILLHLGFVVKRLQCKISVNKSKCKRTWRPCFIHTIPHSDAVSMQTFSPLTHSPLWAKFPHHLERGENELLEGGKAESLAKLTTVHQSGIRFLRLLENYLEVLHFSMATRAAYRHELALADDSVAVCVERVELRSQRLRVHAGWFNIQ